MNLKREIELLFEIGCFRFMQRTWKRFLNSDFQNNTEHSYRVAWLALLIAKHEKVGNEEKILKMAMVHDLPESRSTDVDYLSRQYVIRNEKQATEDMFEGTLFEEEMIEICREYQTRESIESRIVKDADNLDVDLELKEQKERGFHFDSYWSKQRKSAVYPRLYTKTAKKLWMEIQKSNPHNWHLLGRNRFRDGDWKKPLK